VTGLADGDVTVRLDVVPDRPARGDEVGEVLQLERSQSRIVAASAGGDRSAERGGKGDEHVNAVGSSGSRVSWTLVPLDCPEVEAEASAPPK
jgi:hypothetical protein